MEQKFKGILPAIASPCDENDIFLPDKFAEHASSLYDAGVHGLYVCGATGDGYKMRLEERKQAVEIAVELSGEHNGVAIVHVGTSNTRDATELAEHAAKVGADAVASMPPANCKQSQLVSYYSDIARASQLPVFVYHYPMLTGRNPTVDEMLELLDIPQVAGLKLTDWNLFFMKRLLIARPDIKVFNGFDQVLCPALLYGAHGGIGSTYNLFPKLFLGIYQALQQGEVSRALDLQSRLFEFSDLAWKYGSPIILEFLMQRKGYPHIFRRPRRTADEQVLKKIQPELDKKIALIEQAI